MTNNPRKNKPGQGRKPPPVPLIRVSVRLPEDVLEAARRSAKAFGISLNALINKIMEEGL